MIASFVAACALDVSSSNGEQQPSICRTCCSEKRPPFWEQSCWLYYGMSLSEMSGTFGKALDVPFDLSGQGGQY